jgi:hypothetical protein
MSRNYLVFGDIEGKLDALRVECTKCSRRGVYYVHRLIEKHGRKGNMMKWKELLNGDCPRRVTHTACKNVALGVPRSAQGALNWTKSGGSAAMAIKATEDDCMIYWAKKRCSLGAEIPFMKVVGDLQLKLDSPHELMMFSSHPLSHEDYEVFIGVPQRRHRRPDFQCQRRASWAAVDVDASLRAS